MYYFSMFSGCTKLKSISFEGKTFGDNSTNLDGMFSGCSSLEYLKLNGLINGSAVTADNMFSGCSSLVEIDLKGCTMDAGICGNMFSNCLSLEKIIVDEGTDWSEDILMGTGMFSACASIPNFDFSKTDKSMAKDFDTYGEGYFSASGNYEQIPELPVVKETFTIRIPMPDELVGGGQILYRDDSKQEKLEEGTGITLTPSNDETALIAVDTSVIATVSAVNAKPTILSGTTDPTSAMGKNGDIYVKYS